MTVNSPYKNALNKKIQFSDNQLVKVFNKNRIECWPVHVWVHISYSIVWDGILSLGVGWGKRNWDTVKFGKNSMVEHASKLQKVEWW